MTIPDRNHNAWHHAFVLHSVPYRDTSRIVDFFTASEGRLALMVKGARQRSGRPQAALQPFTPVIIGWRGRGDLPTLSQIEICAPPIVLSGSRALQGLYLNELLIKMLGRGEAMVQLFNSYGTTLIELSQTQNSERALRMFEKDLLQEMGYGVILDTDNRGGKIERETWYRYELESGPVRVTNSERNGEEFLGANLLSFASGYLDCTASLSDAKRLMRYLLHAHLGNKPLNSRRLARSLNQLNDSQIRKSPYKEDN